MVDTSPMGRPCKDESKLCVDPLDEMPLDERDRQLHEWPCEPLLNFDDWFEDLKS